MTDEQKNKIFKTLGFVPDGEIYADGEDDAPILVVCDAPPRDAYKRGQAMSNAVSRVFAEEAEKNGFKREDFSFITPCPPMPDKVKDSDSRQSKYLEFFKEDFDDLISEFSPQLVVYLGKSAGRQFTGRAIKITKVRGQVKKTPEGKPTLPLLSPSHILRRPELRDVWEADFRYMAALRDSNWDADLVAETKEGAVYEWADDLCNWLQNRPKALFVDTEFRNLRWYSDKHLPICIQLTDEEGKALTIPVSSQYVKRNHLPYSSRKMDKLKRQLKELMEDPAIAKAGFNFKIDMHVMENLGIKTRNWYVDAQMLAFAVDENMMTKSQDECVRRWVPEMQGYADAFNDKFDKSNMMTVPANDMLRYGSGDVDSGIRLVKRLVTEVKKDARQWNVLMKVQMPALRTFQKSERVGISVDVDQLRELQADLEVREKEAYEELIKEVPAKIKRRHLAMDNQRGKDPKQILSFGRDAFVRDILFTKDGFGLEPVVFTKTTRNLSDDQKIPSISSKEHLPYFEDRCEFVGRLKNYSKLQKMRTTYVGKEYDEERDGPSGFWQYLSESVDGCIHPSFLLHRTVTGRTACLTGDTLVTVLDKRGEVPIRDVKKGDWVWSFDDDLKPKPCQVSWAARTIRGAKLIQVSYLTNGARDVRSIRCTEDHRFRLRDGSYVEAKDLTNGDRVLSLERSINHAGYRLVYYTGCEGRAKLEHRMIDESLTGKISENVHHIDEVKTNNLPSNLEGLTCKEHALRHGWTEEKIRKMLATRHEKLAKGDIKLPEPKFGKSNPNYYELDLAWAEDVLWQYGGKPSVFRDVYGLDYTCVMQKLNDAGIDWKGIRAHFNKRGEFISQDMIERASKCVRLRDAAKILGVNFYKTKELLAEDHNHLITGVEFLEEREDVYDITVPSTHCFIANGICVHNSADPNAQNFPKRGELAKMFRKVFKAREGHKLIEVDLSQAELRIAAWMSMEPTMLKIYREGGDIHAATAAKLVNKSQREFAEGRRDQTPLIEVANDWVGSGVYLKGIKSVSKRREATVADFCDYKRFQAKAVNFGFLYGMGWRKFKSYAKTDYGIDFTDDESENIRNIFFSTYDRLPEWHQKMREFVREHGYVRSLHGAVRHLPNIESEDDMIKGECERQAINSPVQRFASDLGLIGLHRFARDVDWNIARPIAFIHDAVVVEVREEYAEEIAANLKWYMESSPLYNWFNLDAPIPIVADASIGMSLGEMEEVSLESVEPDWFTGDDLVIGERKHEEFLLESR